MSRQRGLAVGLAMAAALFLIGCDGTGQPAAPSAEGEPPRRNNVRAEGVAGGEQSLPRDDTPAEAPTGEVLLADPPEGWVETGAMQTPALRMAEYGPAEPAENTLERITFEAQPGKPLPDPIQFVLAVSRDLEARCSGFEDVNVSSGLENGYPTSVRLMICPAFKDSPHGQVVMAKAIQGTEEFYVITRRLQVPPMRDSGQPLTAQDMAEWTTHLRGVQVCDTRDPEHPCPDFANAAGEDAATP